MERNDRDWWVDRADAFPEIRETETSEKQGGFKKDWWWFLMSLLGFLIVLWGLLSLWHSSQKRVVQGNPRKGIVVTAPSRPSLSNLSFPDIIQALQGNNQLPSEIAGILTQDQWNAWKMVPPAGGNRVFIYPKMDAPGHYWQIKYHKASNQWVLSDPIYWTDDDYHYRCLPGSPYWPDCQFYDYDRDYRGYNHHYYYDGYDSDDGHDSRYYNDYDRDGHGYYKGYNEGGRGYGYGYSRGESRGEGHGYGGGESYSHGYSSSHGEGGGHGGGYGGGHEGGRGGGGGGHGGGGGGGGHR